MPFTTEKLHKFIGALAVDRGHLGLIVTSGDPLPVSISVSDMQAVNIDRATDPEAMLTVLLTCARKKQWCRLNLTDGSLPGRLYNQLRNISTMGHLAVIERGIEGKEEEIRWPAEAKILVVIEKRTLEHMEVSTFLNLFGPILRES